MARTLDTLYIYIYIWTNLINRLTVWVALHANQNKHTTYLSSTGLFAEAKTYITNNRVRDGQVFIHAKNFFEKK